MKPSYLTTTSPPPPSSTTTHIPPQTTSSLLPSLPLVSKKDYQCTPCGTPWLRTLEGVVCPCCGVVLGRKEGGTTGETQEFDFATTYLQKSNYDMVRAQSNTINRFEAMSYMFFKYLTSIPNYDLVGEKVQNSIICQGMNIVDRLIETGVIGLKSNPETTVCAVLCILLEKEGVLFNEVVKVFKEEVDSSVVNGLVKSIVSLFPDALQVDIGRVNFATRTLNQLDIEFKYHKRILQLFKRALSGVYLNGTHFRLVLYACVLLEMRKVDKEGVRDIEESIYLYLDVNKTTLTQKVKQLEKVVLGGEEEGR